MASIYSLHQHDDSLAAALAMLRELAESRATSDELRVAVDDALDRGASWQSIGDALDIRRGAAYQRFRSRPQKT